MGASPDYLKMLEDMADLHRRKAAGYSGDKDTWANFREAIDWGTTPLQGCLIRMGDKYRRAQNLVRNPANDQVGEPIKDTLQDLAAYALIAICLLNEEERDAQKAAARAAFMEQEAVRVANEPLDWAALIDRLAASEALEGLTATKPLVDPNPSKAPITIEYVEQSYTAEAIDANDPIIVAQAQAMANENNEAVLITSMIPSDDPLDVRPHPCDCEEAPCHCDHA